MRIIVTTLQKFPVIFQEVDKAAGRCFAIIVDEAHSSQMGSAALKLKTALADTEEALREYAELEGKAEEELDPDDKLINEIISRADTRTCPFSHLLPRLRIRRWSCSAQSMRTAASIRSTSTVCGRPLRKSLF